MMPDEVIGEGDTTSVVALGIALTLILWRCPWQPASLVSHMSVEASKPKRIPQLLPFG
jgi:hypothetical protein